MCVVFADFHQKTVLDDSEAVFRFDTKLYPFCNSSVHEPTGGKCLGAVVMLNPGDLGDGRPHPRKGWPCDRTLTRVEKAFALAHELRGREKAASSWVRIWNVIYVRDSVDTSAKAFLQTQPGVARRPFVCPTETESVPFSWFAWEMDTHSQLMPGRRRLLSQVPASEHDFFVGDKDAGLIVTRRPYASEGCQHPNRKAALYTERVAHAIAERL